MKKTFLKCLGRQCANFISQQYLILFFILTLSIKLYIFNTYVTDVTWSSHYWFGIICSCFSAAVIFLPFLFVRKYKNLFATILALLISILLFIDTVYYSYFSALPSVGILNLINETGGVGSAIFDLIKWQYFLYFVDILLAFALVKPIHLLAKKYQKYILSKKESLLACTTFTVIILVGLCYSISLSGINNLIDVYNQSYNSVATSQYYGLLVTHAIDTIRYANQEIVSISASEKAELRAWVKTNKPDQQVSSLNGIAAGKNVILIQVESLGSFVINQTINNQEITPTLNNLTKTAEYFPNNRFIIGAGHTSDTDFVVNSSYFPLDNAAVFVRYGQDDFTSLPKLMSTAGYSTYVYHGYNRNFWSRDTAMNSLGYQKFYASDNYTDGAKLNMGLNDGDFLNETADYIANQPKPSLSTVITLSSHVPFEITDLTKELDLDASDYPDQVGGYLEDINYVDRMLAQFFNKLKEKGLYDDSLIIIYGDHTPVLSSFSAGSVNYDAKSDQALEVPLFIKLPNQTAGQTHTNLGTSLDIMPTVLDLTGTNTGQLMFGTSLFAQIEDSPMTCPNHIIVFSGLGDCETTQATEKNMSAKIIRYNQFQNINQ